MENYDVPKLIEASAYNPKNLVTTLTSTERVTLWDFYDKWLPICDSVIIKKVTVSGVLQSIYGEVRHGYPLTYHNLIRLHTWISEYNRYMITLHDVLLMICIDSQSITETELLDFLETMEYSYDVMPRRLKCISNHCLASTKKELAFNHLERLKLVGKLTNGGNEDE